MTWADAFGAIVRIELNDRGWTGAELARRAGFSRHLAWKLEQGSHVPHLTTIENLARALGCQPHALVMRAQKFRKEASK